MPSSLTTFRTFAGTYSCFSSGVCTLTTLRPRVPYSAYTDSIHGKVARQFEQSKAQNSTNTTEPRIDNAPSGDELIHSEDAVWVKAGKLSGVPAALAAQGMTARSKSRRPENLRCMFR